MKGRVNEYKVPDRLDHIEQADFLEGWTVGN